MYSLFWATLIFWAAAVAEGCEDPAVTKAFRANQIIPDILRDGPPRSLTATFAGTKTVQLGNTFKLIDVANAPTVQWPTNGQRRNQLYTVMLVDPDAKSRKTHEFRSFLHWLVTNVRGNSIISGRTLASYIPPGPPTGSGFHRYVMLVFRQQRPISARAIKCYKIHDRIKFDVVAFAQKHNLDRGHPFAGNFFQSERDATVPE